MSQLLLISTFTETITKSESEYYESSYEINQQHIEFCENYSQAYEKFLQLNYKKDFKCKLYHIEEVPEVFEILQKYNNNQFEIKKLEHQSYLIEFEIENKKIKLKELQDGLQDQTHSINDSEILLSYSNVDIQNLTHEIIADYEKLNQIEEKINCLKILKIEINCPKCNKQHIDKDEWETKSHKTHLCEYCGNEWRPFDFATCGAPTKPPHAI